MLNKFFQLSTLFLVTIVLLSCGGNSTKQTQTSATAKFGAKLLPAGTFNAEIQGLGYNNFDNCLQLAVYSDGTQQVWLANVSCPTTPTLVNESQIIIRLMRDPTSGILKSLNGSVIGQSDTQSPPQTITDLCQPYSAKCEVDVDGTGLFTGLTPPTP